MTLMTLFADASYCLKSKAGGWGAWFKTAEMAQGEMLGGTFKTPMTNSAEAELAALANAAARISNAGKLAPVQELMLQSDCMRALQLLANRLPGVVRRKHQNGLHVPDGNLTPTDMEQRAIDLFLTIRNDNALILVVRHVKGHKPGGGRAWVNRQCDVIAKRHMEAERKRLSGK